MTTADTPDFAVVRDWMYDNSMDDEARALHDRGYSYGFIADSCGISEAAANKLGRGETRYCRRWVADAIADFAEFAGDSPGVARDRRNQEVRKLSNEARRERKEAIA